VEEINFTQHEREIIIDACLGELDNTTFNESYFDKVFEDYRKYINPQIREKIIQIGVKQWFDFVVKIDQTRQIPTTHISILGSILSGYAKQKLDHFPRQLPKNLSNDLLDKIIEVNDLDKKLRGTSDDSFGVEKSLNKIREEIKNGLI